MEPEHPCHSADADQQLYKTLKHKHKVTKRGSSVMLRERACGSMASLVPASPSLSAFWAQHTSNFGLDSQPDWQPLLAIQSSRPSHVLQHMPPAELTHPDWHPVLVGWQPRTLHATGDVEFWKTNFAALGCSPASPRDLACGSLAFLV